MKIILVSYEVNIDYNRLS